MEIIKILELSQEQKVAEIAKNHLLIGEKKTRTALHNAGCVPNKGLKGWRIKKGYEKNLNKSVYEFLDISPRKEEEVMASVEKTVEEKDAGVKRRPSSLNISSEIKRKLKIYAAQTEKFEYEIIEKAIIEYIKNNPVE